MHVISLLLVVPTKEKLKYGHWLVAILFTYNVQ
jgi:hypothetical protein